jgi:anthranilate 1,2-dioxygenase large subunit
MTDIPGCSGRELTWPKHDLTEVPYAVYIDNGVFAAEGERIFRGSTWNYLGLEVEIINPGDFLTTYVGTTPVIVNRALDGSIHAFVNRCAHRGSMVAREGRGNCTAHTCIYYQWSYDLTGKLIGVPYRRGINGNGGFPSDFKPEHHGLETLRIAKYNGIIFGTFSETVEPLDEYMGQALRMRFDQLCGRPIRVTGYQRQYIRGNWKLYFENVKDAYHGSLLHSFNSNFGMFRSTQRGSSQTAYHGMHCVLTTYGKTAEEELSSTYANVATHKPKFQLEDPSVVSVFREHKDGMVTTILSMFPALILAQIGNHLGFRHIRPKSPREFELVWANFVYEDDDDTKLNARRKQGNLLGPAGYLTMEDSEALELAQKCAEGDRGRGHAFIELGGRGFEDQAHLVTEVPIRAFWRGYCQLMGFNVGAEN